MKRTSNLSRLLKLSQQDNIGAWQAVLEEVSNPGLPSGLSLEGIHESAESAKKLETQISQSQQSPGTFSAEDAKNLEKMVKDPEILKLVNQYSDVGVPEADVQDKAASQIINTLFIREASKYFSRKESVSILRDINLYQSLNSPRVKIASSRVDLESRLLEKQYYFNKMCSDSSYLSGSEVIKISIQRDGSKLKKEAISLDGIWSGVKEVGKTVIKGIGSTFSGLLKIAPFIGLVWAIYDGYESFKKAQSSEEVIKSHFSDLVDGDLDQLLNPTFIGSLIDKFSHDPESLLKIAQLNKVSRYYKQEFLNVWYSVAWAISDLIISGAIILTGGAAAVAEGITAWVVKALGFAAIAGPVATGFLDFGTREYSDNEIKIKTIAEMNLKSAPSVEVESEPERESEPEEDSEANS